MKEFIDLLGEEDKEFVYNNMSSGYPILLDPWYMNKYGKTFAELVNIPVIRLNEITNDFIMNLDIKLSEIRRLLEDLCTDTTALLFFPKSTYSYKDGIATNVSFIGSYTNVRNLLFYDKSKKLLCMSLGNECNYTTFFFSQTNECKLHKITFVHDLRYGVCIDLPIHPEDGIVYNIDNTSSTLEKVNELLTMNTYVCV